MATLNNAPDDQIVGIVAIFFAVELDKAELPMETDYLLIAFVAFHFLMHLVLSILMCSSDMRKDKASRHCLSAAIVTNSIIKCFVKF